MTLEIWEILLKLGFIIESQFLFELSTISVAFEIRVNVSFYDKLKILKVSIKLNSTSLI